VDPSSLIFVALIVAWAVYLVPKALEHHEESLRSRAVSTFSKSVRVLARREPSGPSARDTDLVTGRPAAPGAGRAAPAAPPRRPEVVYDEVPVRLSPAQLRARRAAAKRAVKRRRNVLSLLLLALAGVAALVLTGFVGRIWLAVPVVLLAGWLLACRAMVRKEQVVPTRRVPRAPSGAAPTAVEVDDETGEVVAVLDEDDLRVAETGDAGESVPAEPEPVPAAQGRWDPVEAPLPTYVSKPAAPRRTVRTIDLDSTGVWSSGRKAADSALAREAEASAREAKQAERERRRAAGS